MAESQNKYVPKVIGGINRYERPDLLKDQECYTATNFRIENGSLIVTPGYEKATTPLSTGLVSDVTEAARRIHEFQNALGLTKLLLISNYALYLFDGIDTWDQVRTSTSEDFTTNYAVNNKLTDAAHALSNGDKIKVGSGDTLPGGLSNSVIYYVINAGTNDFELSLTATGSAVALTSDGVGTHTYYPCFSGTDTRAVKAVTYTPSDAVVFTNGSDPVWIYIDDGAGYEVRPLGGLTSSDTISGLTAEAVTTARSLLIWNTRLWLFYTVEGGDLVPQQIRWSSVADIEDFSDVAPSDGGYERLADRDDAILTAELLGTDMLVYRDGSIVKGQWVGSASRTVKFSEVISDDGALGPNAVAVTQDRHIFFGRYNVYSYNGGTSLEPIGDNVRSLIYGTGGIMDLDKRTDITCMSISATREVWTSILVATSYDVTGSPSTYKSTVLIYNLTEKAWTLREFDDSIGDTRIVDIAEARLANVILWEDLDLAWSAAGALRWNSQVFATAFPTLFICSTYQLLHYNYTASQDAGVDIPFEFVSKDFIGGQGYLRYNYIEFQHLGGEGVVSYSIDRGNTFVTFGTLPAQSLASRTKLFLNISAEAFRFKITGLGGGFNLQSFDLNFTQESEY